MVRKTRQILSDAIHEAGHAVAGVALRRRFRHVTIIPDPARGSAGHVAVRSPPSDASMERHFDYLIMALAGHYAELECGFRPARYRSQEDRTAANDHALELAGDAKEASLWIKLAAIRARRLMTLWRPAVEAVAAALIDGKRLSYEEVREIALQARGLAPID